MTSVIRGRLFGAPVEDGNRELGRARIDFGIGEAIPYVLVEVPSLGCGAEQLPIDLFGNAEVTVNRPTLKFQFQSRILFPVSSRIQRGGLQLDSRHAVRLGVARRVALGLGPHPAW